MKTVFISALSMWAIFGCSPSPPPSEPGKGTTAAESASNPPDKIDLKTAAAVQQRLRNVPESATIETLAKTIAEVDGWLVAPGDEEQAQKAIGKAIDDLRKKIKDQVSTLMTAAIKATKSPEAVDKLSQINLLLSLFPVPQTTEQRKDLEQLSVAILTTSRRVEELRRLRYNSWAIEQIRGGLMTFSSHTSGVVKTVNPDKSAILNSCVDYLRYIDASLLEPAVMNMYAELLQRCNSALDDDRKVKLASTLVDPSLQRHNLDHH
jgi:hypothetical protein